MADTRTPGSNVIVVTGATSGIGLAASVRFAQRGEQVVLVGRDPARLVTAAREVQRVAGALPATFQADFAVLDDVRGLAGALRSAYPRIALLANNAGALIPRRITTVDGFELTIQVNHLAPFLLTNLLADRVDRVVTTASAAHRQGRLDPDRLSGSGSYVPLLAYGASKLANILFAAESARRWPQVLSTSYHPGVVRTRYGHDSPLVAFAYRVAFWLRKPDQGADTMVWLRYQDDLVNGAYYVDRRRQRPMRRAEDPDLAARLWEASAVAVGLGAPA